MSDIALVVVAAPLRLDWAVAKGGIVAGGDLQTAIYVSLFTWRVLPADQAPPDGTDDPRGWWGDTYEDQPIGSLLWTLARTPISNRTAFLADARQICLDALQWLADDGVVSSVTVTTWFVGPETLGIDVTAMPPSGPLEAKFAWAWQGV